jgi:hypothetical protein
MPPITSDDGEARTSRKRSHQRSRSPRRRDGHEHKRRRSRSPAKPVKLPYQAQPLSRRDYDVYRPLFQSYLDIQKNIQLDDLDEREARGRWKSFVSRWNRGDLARSWYDASMLATAQETVKSYEAPARPTRRPSPSYTKTEESDDDDFGPAPPTNATRHGPTAPRLEDLTYRNEMRDEDRAAHVDDVRLERNAERKAQKAQLEELVPRADPGSRERQLEKKRETTGTLQSFRDAKDGGEVEVAEADLLGDDGIDTYKRKKKEEERKKSEREIRRDEMQRARDAERSDRLADRREKEATTMQFLMQIAKERFG